MKFITIRELRESSRELRSQLQKSGKLVLTSNGKPIALLTPVSEDNLEEEMLVQRRARALTALENIQAGSAQRGLERMSPLEIERVIGKARSRKRRVKAC